MDIPVILEYALSLSVTFKYIIVFVATMIEGPILMVAAGFLIHLGVFEPWPLYATIIAGDLAGDLVWYYVGYRFAEPFLRKHGHFFSLTPESFERIKKLFIKYHEKILFLSKVTVGFGFALGTLIVAGATRMPLRKYIVLNLAGEIVLVAVLLSIGYFFAELYKYVDKSLQVGFLVVSGVILVGIIYGFAGYMKKRADKL